MYFEIADQYVYRRPGIGLIHVAGDGKKTACKHYRLTQMDQHDIRTVSGLNQVDGGNWCTDCLMSLNQIEERDVYGA